MQVSDGELVNRCLEGDKDSFGELIMRYQGVVRGLAYHLVGNFQDAEDLAQESFIRAYVRLSDLQDRAKFASWLKRVTFSVCMNWLKAHRHDQAATLEERIYQVPDPTSYPSDSVEAAELRDAVLQAVANLPEMYRLPLTLFHLDGLSYNKVADFLDLPVSTVKWRLHQARRMLKKGMLQMVAEVFEEYKPSETFAEETMEKISILVADHNPAGRDILIKIFTREGYDVHGAEGGLEALERLEHSDYQVAIVDTRMPDMDGVKLVEQIAQKYPNTVVIVMTAYGSVEMAVEAIKVGAYDFIERPFPIERLLNTVRSAIERRSAQEGQKSCPKCHEKMQSDWQYCPYDGTKVG
jgi:RNA polymerase sigma-70 factor (ECF subfamily)